MDYTAIFERVEKKYLLSAAQYEFLLPILTEHMQMDQYKETTVCSLYLDTSDDLLIRRSLEKPRYKEKMRLRSYGVPNSQDTVFLEIKKKSSGIVYKRRMAMTAHEAMAYIHHGFVPQMDSQILHEIDYMKRRYALHPAMVLCCERTAYAEMTPTPDALRITIDRNIRYRTNALDLRLGDGGMSLLDPNQRLMELKTARALPLWLCHALSEARIYPSSFSKYGRAYEMTNGECVRRPLLAV